MSDLLLSRGTPLGSGGGLLELGGGLIQELRERPCGLPRVSGRGGAGASSLYLGDSTLAAGDLAGDRGSPPHSCRVLTLHRVVIALHMLRIVRGPAGGEVALIRPTFALIRRVLPPVGDLITLIRDPIALIGDQFALVGGELTLCCGLRAPEDRRPPLANRPTRALQPGTLPLQCPVIGAKLRRAAPDIGSQTHDLGAPSRVMPLEPGLRPHDSRTVCVQLRRVALELCTPPLKLSPVVFAARIPLQRRSFMAGSTLLVDALAPVKLTRAIMRLLARHHVERIPPSAQRIKPRPRHSRA